MHDSNFEVLWSAHQESLFNVKLMFSKKATKIDEIFSVDLTVTTYCQIDGEDFVNFCGLLRKRELYIRNIFCFFFAMILQVNRYRKMNLITSMEQCLWVWVDFFQILTTIKQKVKLKQWMKLFLYQLLQCCGKIRC